MKPYARYAKEIFDGIHYGGTWTPGTPLRLGQIGTFQDGVFVPQGHLSSLGVNFDPDIDSRPTTYTYASSDGVTFRFKARGDSTKDFKALADIEAGVAFTFRRAHAVVFSAAKCLEHRIGDILRLQAELAALLNNGMWRQDWAVVTHLVAAETATIVLSSAANTTLELEASGAVGGQPAKLADISSGVALAYADSMNQLIVASSGLTPLFHSLRLRRKLWTGEPGFILNKGTVTPSARARAEPDSFERVDFDELLE